MPAVNAALPPRPLRPPRPRQVRRPEGPYSMERLGRDALAILDALRSRRSTGAASRWAAWSACGSARMRRSASSGSCCRTPRPAATQRIWNDRIRPSPRRARRRSSRARWSAGSPRASATRAGRCDDADMFLKTKHGRLYRLLRGDPRHGSARDHPAITAPTLVIAGSQDGARRPRWRIHRQAHSGRKAEDVRRRAHRECRVRAALHGRGARLPHPEITEDQPRG